MKKAFMALVISISFAAYSFAGCTGPMYPVVMSNGENYTCCPVGNGSVSSCTDGKTWWNEPYDI